MSNEAEDEEPVTVAVRVDHYNEIMHAADLGFVATVRRRDALRKLMDSLPSYPEREAGKMKSATALLLNDDIEVEREDVAAMWRRADDQVKRLAAAMNSRYAPGVGDKYKA